MQPGEPATGIAPSAPVPRWLVAVALGIALGIAGFTGFRIPSSWCTTLDAVSLFDGFHRRFAIGTVLRPLAVATGYNYWALAAYNFAVLAAVLAVLAVAAVRTPLLGRRVLVLAFLLLPTGGFLFHEIGYFDQVLYLLVFAALWLVERDRWAAAICVMAVAPCVHEIAILTVIPVFGLVALRTLTPRRALIATAVPVAVGLLVMAIPQATTGAVATLSATLHGANFAFRHDALSLFERSQAASWQLYNVEGLFVQVRPAAVVAVAAFVALWLTDRGLRRTSPGQVAGWLILVASCVAIAAPALLILGGWDGNRWVFLILGNFFVVSWIALGDRRTREPSGSAVFVLATALLVFGQFSIGYFDHYAPRDITLRATRRSFLHQIADRSMFAIPTW